MQKSSSIRKLEELRLNTLDYFISKDEREVTHFLAKHMEDRLSMRTERGTDFMCPYYYMMSGKELLSLALQHIKEGYALILAPSIDTKGCQAFGAAMFEADGKTIVEYVIGEGKVRELDNHPEKRVAIAEAGSLCLVKADSKDPQIIRVVVHINDMVKRLKEALYDEGFCVVEWSLYNRPIGRLKRTEIFWEIRS